MLILILINIVIIIYLYFKYYKFPKSINNIQEDLNNIDPIIIGYINDRGFDNSFDLVLSEIIELNIKGYIIIEYNKENIDKYNYIIKQNIDTGFNKLNKYELAVMNFLFSNKTEITKNELEEKLENTFSSYNIRFVEIEKILNEDLIRKKIIDKNKQNELHENTKKYIKISIILVLLIIILRIIGIIKFSLLYILIYILEKVVSSVLLLEASIYTIKGQILKYNIDRYKIKLENKEFLSDKNKIENIVKNKEFATSIALHINTQAKQAFIEDKMIKQARKVSKKVMINILSATTIILLIGIIIAKTISLLSPGFIVWIYIIMAIAVACVADITLYKKK